jgi:hypothetical protein
MRRTGTIVKSPLEARTKDKDKDKDKDKKGDMRGYEVFALRLFVSEDADQSI